MKVKEDELYAVLQYGTLAIPLSMLAELYKHSFYIDRSYNGNTSEYDYKVVGRANRYDISIIEPEILTAALVAQKME